MLDQRATKGRNRQKTSNPADHNHLSDEFVCVQLLLPLLSNGDRKLLGLNCWELLLQCADVLSDSCLEKADCHGPKNSIDGYKLETGCEPRCLSDTQPPASSSSLRGFVMAQKHDFIGTTNQSLPH